MGRLKQRVGTGGVRRCGTSQRALVESPPCGDVREALCIIPWEKETEE